MNIIICEKCGKYLPEKHTIKNVLNQKVCLECYKKQFIETSLNPIFYKKCELD